MGTQGATSWGVSGTGIRCPTHLPSVYARVSHYVNWIKRVTGDVLFVISKY